MSACLRELLVDYMGIRAERDGRVSVAELNGEDVDRHAGEEECRRVDAP
jgi:hypothetical protein